MIKNYPAFRRSHLTFLVVGILATGFLLLSLNRNYLGQIFGSTTPANFAFNQTSISVVPGQEFSVPFTISTNSTAANAGISAMKVVLRYDQGSSGLVDLVAPPIIEFPSTSINTIVKNVTQSSDAQGKYLSFTAAVPVSGTSSLQKSGTVSLKFKSMAEGTSYITFDTQSSEVVGVTGSDPLFQISATNSMMVTSGSTLGLRVYKAVNLNGPALVVDGVPFEAESSSGLSVSGNRFENQSVALVPSVGGTKAQMIRSSLWGRGTSFPKITVPNAPTGWYKVYLYVWEDNNAQQYSITLEGTVALANYNSGSAGTWRRVGPYDILVTDGALDIASSGGDANLSAIEVWSEAGVTPPEPTPSLISTPTVIPSTAPTFSPTRIPTLVPTATPIPSFSVTPFPTSAPISGFYRGINFNGSGGIISGNSWMGSPSNYVSTSAYRFNLSWQTLINTPPLELKSMLNGGYWGAPITINNVENGTYEIYLYLREDDGTVTFNLNLEGVRVDTSISTGAPRTWKKIGPYTTTVSDGNLRISTSGIGAALFTGIEMYRK